MRLALATEAELLAPASPRAVKPKASSDTNFRQTFLVIGIMVAACIVAGLVWLRLYGR
jgi:hypothetical protein